MTNPLDSVNFSNIHDFKVDVSTKPRDVGRRFIYGLSEAENECTFHELFKHAEKLSSEAKSSPARLKKLSAHVSKLQNVEKEGIQAYEAKAREKWGVVYQIRTFIHRIFGGSFWGSHLDRLTHLQKDNFSEFFKNESSYFTCFESPGVDLKVDGKKFHVDWKDEKLSIWNDNTPNLITSCRLNGSEKVIFENFDVIYGDSIQLFDAIEQKVIENISNSMQPKLVKKSVTDLGTHVKDDYKPRSEVLSGLTYPNGAEAKKQPIFDLREASHIERLASDVFNLVLKSLSPIDRASASMVNKYFGYESLKTAKEQEFLLVDSFTTFLCKNCPNEAENLRLIRKNVNFSTAIDFSDLSEMLVAYRSKVIEVLAKFEDKDLKNLEISAVRMTMPFRFESIFDLVRLDQKFKQDNHIDSYQAMKKICDLGEIEMAYDCLRYLEIRFGRKHPTYGFTDCCRALIELLIKRGNFEKVMELSLDKEVFHQNALVALFSCGKFEDGKKLIAFASEHKLIESPDNDLEIIPIVELISKSQFEDAIDYKNRNLKKEMSYILKGYGVDSIIGNYKYFVKKFNKELKDLNDVLDYKATRVIHKALERSCYQLIQVGKLDEVEKLISLMEINMKNPCVSEIIKDLAIEWFKSNRFDKALACSAKLTDSISKAELIAELCQMSEFKIYDFIDQIRFDGRNPGTHAILIYKKAEKNDLEGALAELSSCNATWQYRMLKYLCKKFWESGQIDKAIEVAFLIKDPVIKAKTLRIFK